MEKHHKCEHTNVAEHLENDRASKKQKQALSTKHSKQLSLESVIQSYSSKLIIIRKHKLKLNCIVAENSVRRATLDKALLNMIVTDLQPVSVVEDKGFQNFVKVLDPKYSAPSRRTIMREHLPRLYESKKEELMGILANISWCSFTTDLWTSRTTMGFITLTCPTIRRIGR